MPYCIYKLVCDDCDYIYVGSTKSFVHRKSSHKSKCETHHTKVYKTIREYGGWENWRMVIIEECDDTIQTKRQAHMREEEFRLQLKATLNTIRAFLTEEQKREDNREYNNTLHRKEYNKECNKNYRNRPEVKEHKKEYQKEYQKIYRNRPEVIEHLREYNQRNKERRNFVDRERRRKKKELISSDQHSDTSRPCEDTEEI